ncbi:MAG TPA: hypothetical protein VGQ83_02220 [Polyangia bacterium]|jgi:hypothetical protein
MRASEVIHRKVRDVDVGPDGVLLWIDAGKTDAAKRFFDVPEPLASLLTKLAKDRKTNEWLFQSEV